ncbi:Hypothetical predicted protein [Paramuricea clavata]|uniref:Uncharacterized protein n=1 Tax=Paramuricea clavata TaxID=317549 RepID=A0A7D9JQL3_PARCT|nr:Hypothetical predicted protein [Paramuricea clavata]
MDTSDSLEDRPTHPTDRTSSQASNNTPEGSTPQHQTSSSSLDEATTKEITLKKIYDGLEKYFGSEGNVDIERTSHVKALTNHVNVLLSIKKNCYGSCKICKNISKENLAKPGAAVPPDNSKVTDVVNELTKDIKMTLSTPLTFASQAQNDGSNTNRIEYQHHATWSIEIPAQFPDKPAEVYKQESSHHDPEKKALNDLLKSKHEQKSLVSSDLIMLAIRSNCYCSECYRI